MKRKNYYQIHKNKKPKAYKSLENLTLDRRMEECYEHLLVLIEQVKEKIRCGKQL